MMYSHPMNAHGLAPGITHDHRAQFAAWLRQAQELDKFAATATPFTKALALYYSSLNLAKALVLAKTGSTPAPTHGLDRRGENQGSLLLRGVKLVPNGICPEFLAALLQSPCATSFTLAELLARDNFVSEVAHDLFGLPICSFFGNLGGGNRIDLPHYGLAAEDLTTDLGEGFLTSGLTEVAVLHEIDSNSRNTITIGIGPTPPPPLIVRQHMVLWLLSEVSRYSPEQMGDWGSDENAQLAPILSSWLDEAQARLPILYLNEFRKLTYVFGALAIVG